MKLPKKIEPDNIKDSIVEVKFLSTLPYEIYLGRIHDAIGKSYEYINRGDSSQIQKLMASNAGLALFYNDRVKFEVIPGAIVFNCIENYISWEMYFPEIKSILTNIHKAKFIDYYTRVGIRYISEYPEKDIREITNLAFSFGMPNVKSENYFFRTEYNKEKHRVILNLSSKIPKLIKESEINNISTIDIDVINDNLKVDSIDSVFDIINNAHTEQKISYFSLLKEEFLNSLKPKY
jgi:uncharacterized protein (TIGR04255 family)